MYQIVAHIQELRAARPSEGLIVRTLGYYEAGDGGGAEYRIQRADPCADTDMAGVIPLPGRLQAHLLVQGGAGVHYKVFGTRSDGVYDDGIAIKQAHAFANRHGLPVVNHSGHYWIKDTHGIDIQTNVSWGFSVFHLDESYNRQDQARFHVAGAGEQASIRLDRSRQLQILPYLKKGQYLIPELREYANHLAIVRDENSPVGWRSGDRGLSWAKEDFFYVEEHGRIIGDVTWDFDDMTSFELIACEPNYLVIEGGSFYLSGDNSGDNGAYKWCGFRVERSRTIIRNQFVGLEPGRKDVATDPRRGFYAFFRCVDITLEHIRMIPFEKRRGGAANVPHGTYGIFGDRVLNLLLRDVTAEGSYVHWGVIGTNLIKSFRVDGCRLNRIDVHFHCHNLYIRDSEIGLNGITVTGGGDLLVDNTRVLGNTFIEFRKDYGSRWDGDIRIRNCKLMIAETENSRAVLSFDHEDVDYGYELVYGRTIKVEDLAIDFTGDPTGSTEIEMMLHPALHTAGGRPIRHPASCSFSEIRKLAPGQI